MKKQEWQKQNAEKTSSIDKKIKTTNQVYKCAKKGLIAALATLVMSGIAAVGVDVGCSQAEMNVYSDNKFEAENARIEQIVELNNQRKQGLIDDKQWRTDFAVFNNYPGGWGVDYLRANGSDEVKARFQKIDHIQKVTNKTCAAVAGTSAGVGLLAVGTMLGAKKVAKKIKRENEGEGKQ